MNTPTSQSLKRFQESVGQLFLTTSTRKCLILKSSSDVGVVRNGGRNGARFSPQAFLSTFKKFTQDKFISDFSFQDIEVASLKEEQKDFPLAQKHECLRIKAILPDLQKTRIIHIGGGHDHVYPLAMALSEKFEKVVILNIDAHADTRTDQEFHSGTPFRQLEQELASRFHLFQFGLHPFANSTSTLSPFEKGSHHIVWRNELDDKPLQEAFKKINDLVDENTLVLFSLDVDAMSATEVPGVSAVNPAGMKRQQLMDLWKFYQKLPKAHPPIIGIYELNPLYDTLSGVSMKTIASFVFETFRTE